MDRLEAWQTVVDAPPAGLLEAVARADVTRPADLARLRRGHHEPLLAAAIELVAARRRAVAKFPGRPDLVADREGLEQASSAAAAEWKAARLAALGRPIVDLCCGIGGDLMSFAHRGVAEGIDRDPVRAWMAARNAGCPTEAREVRVDDARDRAFHLDPARRRDGRRTLRFADSEPGPVFVAAVASGAIGGAVKLGPGVDPSELPEGDLEFVSERGTLVQAVLWCGAARDGAPRRASRLPDRATRCGTPEVLVAGEMPEPPFALLVPDPALERAGLVAPLVRPLGYRNLAPGLGLPVRAGATTDAESLEGWCTAFRIDAIAPWRPKRVRDLLDPRETGVVTVRTRGRAVDPDRAAAALRGSGGTERTVFVLRLGSRVAALIAEPA